MKSMVRQAHHGKQCHPEFVEGSHCISEFKSMASPFLPSMIHLYSLWLTAFSLVILIIPTAPAESEERWKLIGRSKTDTLWYIDIKTLSQLPDNVVSVWLKTVPAKTGTDFLEGKESTESILKKIQTRNFGDYEYTQGLWELDCDKKAFRILYFAAFNKADEVIASSLTPDAEWSFMVFGSVAETMHEAVCGR